MMKENIGKKEIAIIAITKKGIEIAKKLQINIKNTDVYVPDKFNNSDRSVIFFNDTVTQRITRLFSSYNALICIFSLGAVIRLISPHLKDKRTDPAVLVIDDTAKFVISTLSGHLGGANQLTEYVSNILQSIPVITTAADVNQTISIDLLGKKFGWTVSNIDNVTKVSAMMVNEEKIGVYQDAGEKNWWDLKNLPKNVELVSKKEELLSPDFKGAIIITDEIIYDNILLNKSVIYRPKSLVVGIGLHWNTSKETIINGILQVLKENHLSLKCIKLITSLDKGKHVKGLDDFCREYGFELTLFSKNDLDKVEVPNPSDTVNKFEGTSSVSEASSILGSNGVLIVPKRKFPPDLTVAISRVNNI